MDYLTSQSEDDFAKARNKAFINEIQHLLSPEESKLISLNDVKQMIKPINETYIGMKVIPIEITPGFNKNYYVNFNESEVTTAPRDKKVWDEILSDLQV